MTIKMYFFLRALRKAQRNPDWTIQILDGSKPCVKTYNQSQDDTRVAKLNRYRYCYNSYCAELEKQGFLEINGHFGRMKVTQPGWDYLKLTLQGLLRLTLVDILIPVLVAWITALAVTN